MFLIRLFLFIFFSASILSAADLRDEAEHIIEQHIQWGGLDWTNCQNQVAEYQRGASFRPLDESLVILEKALEYCHWSKGHFDKVLEYIVPKKIKALFSAAWLSSRKNTCDKNIEVCQQQIQGLESLILDLKFKIVLPHIQAFINTSNDKATQGLEIYHQRAPPTTLKDIAKTLEALYQIAALYEEAVFGFGQAEALLAPFPLEEDKKQLQNRRQEFLASIEFCKKEAEEWAEKRRSQHQFVVEQLACLKEEKIFLEAKGKARSIYETDKQIASLLIQLVDCGEGDAEELRALQTAISVFEAALDTNRLTEKLPLLSKEDILAIEHARREHFFNQLKKGTFSPSFTSEDLVTPLDGQKDLLYPGQFYRFFIKKSSMPLQLDVKVYDKNQLVHQETINFPQKGSGEWGCYLTDDGMVLIPEGRLQEFGLDLRINLLSEGVVIAQKASYTNYTFAFSFEEMPLYEVSFTELPPWQLDALRKNNNSVVEKPLPKFPSSITAFTELKDEDMKVSFPTLDKLVEELGKSPLALAQYVQNEIEFVDPYLTVVNGIFQAPAIYRSDETTFLEGQGSPWEQCSLLVYLLRQAGFEASYIAESNHTLPKQYGEKLLGTTSDSDIAVCYPGVLLQTETEAIALYPWMKEIAVTEGCDLYGYLPNEYASADRWIKRYLCNDERILKHIAPDGNDTAGVLFVRFVEEELRKQGLSLRDVGHERTLIKKQFTSWGEFPRPETAEITTTFNDLLRRPELFGVIQVELYSKENPHKTTGSRQYKIASLNGEPFAIHFLPKGESDHTLYFKVGPRTSSLGLDPTDLHLELRVSFGESRETRVFTFSKGVSAAFCYHFGRGSAKSASAFGDRFNRETAPDNRVQSLLAFIGATYFEKCSRAEKQLADLHKIVSRTNNCCGLALLSPDLSLGPLRGEPHLKFPAIDMNTGFTTYSGSSRDRDFLALLIADISSNEHQVLKEVFQDPYAISTVKLLQIAHEEHEKRGLTGAGFLAFTQPIFLEADQRPDVAQSLYFPHVRSLDLRKIQNEAKGLWESVRAVFEEPGYDFSYVYMTPGVINSRDGHFLQSSSYQGMGALITSMNHLSALISSNGRLMNGGFGSRLPDGRVLAIAKREWELVPQSGRYTLQQVFPPYKLGEKLPDFQPTFNRIADVRPEHKSYLGTVNDPIDVVTGAFYIDEVDLTLPGPFPLEIRRNYNSQNPAISSLGHGWKLSLNPELVVEDDKLLASEKDGTVIVYRFSSENSRWEVYLEDNPDLQVINGRPNPFLSYIQDDVLYSPDGSKRIFENNLLKKWVDHAGNALAFFYENNRLTRIESSHGSFVGFLYNHAGQIAEAYAKDGRRIRYSYHSNGDLSEVVLPNGAVHAYDYDRCHRVIRETKPHGKVLENIYDAEGRVVEQRTPVGPRQEMVVSASLHYHNGMTVVVDPLGGSTEYRIFNKQIYKITDPLGAQILESWFIDTCSYFDAEKARIEPSEGGYPRCLKTSTDKRGLVTNYRYDKRGNPTEILMGEVSKRFTYNDRDLCTKEEVLHKATLTTYNGYLPVKVENTTDGMLVSFVENSYTPSGLLQKQNNSGSEVLFAYDSRGFLTKITQKTGTNDPDVVTSFLYNDQGQVVEKITQDGIEYFSYDIMGNCLQSSVCDHSGKLLSSVHSGYNLNGQMIWQQGADPHQTLFLDYNNAGLLKASRRELTKAGSDGVVTAGIAYTLYEYDTFGSLIEEVDALGQCTYRQYDALGRLSRETKNGLSTDFSYEAGGALQTILSPNGGKTTRLYTKEGLLSQEIYPDGTVSAFQYDLFGRLISETKQGVTWDIAYNDALHQIVRACRDTGVVEMRTFDSRGNLIASTDGEGQTSEKAYDGLGRIILDSAPDGRQTKWNYQGDTTICILPSGETLIQRTEAGSVVESKTLNVSGKLVSLTCIQNVPELSLCHEIHGDLVTSTWTNTLGQPLIVERGMIRTVYSYDAIGQCVALTDGEGRTTRHSYDPTGRLIQKVLADGALSEYFYDADSNLTACKMPGGVTWQATYDLMGRKSSEALVADGHLSEQWMYGYEEGRLKTVIDPSGKIHAYTYDALGRLIYEKADSAWRSFAYDNCGNLLSAEQFTGDHSSVKRSYDVCGRLTSETISLNDQTLQETHQAWSPTSRALQVGDHSREFTYEAGRLKKISSESIELNYRYNLQGAITARQTPFDTTRIQYNTSGLPDYRASEALSWDRSGKLISADSKTFTYTSRGALKTAGSESFTFDFGKPGSGVRTHAPQLEVPLHGLDPFGKVVLELSEDRSIQTTYNAMGQVSSRTTSVKEKKWSNLLERAKNIFSPDKENFRYDPWGRLVEVTTPTSTWKASYDALGRRLQTTHNALTITTLYDPETEFQEIGTQYPTQTFWKFYNGTVCDAITNTSGIACLLHDALGNLQTVQTSNKVLSIEPASPYGPRAPPLLTEPDLITFAASHAWQSRIQDPTGLIWLGARTYDPTSGRFLTPDPLGSPLCLNLYAYSTGDPINFHDLSGRFESPVYASIGNGISALGSYAASAFSSDFFQGSMRMAGGVSVMGTGLSICGAAFGTASAAVAAGGILALNGLDNLQAGFRQTHFGGAVDPYTVDLLAASGMSYEAARVTNDYMSLPFTVGAALIKGIASSVISGGKLLLSNSPRALTLARPSLKKGADFIVGPSGIAVPTSRRVLERGFQEAGFASFQTDSKGIGYILPNGNKVRIMEAAGPAPLRASFTNKNGGPIDISTNKPPQPGKGLENEVRLEFVRSRTHLELMP